MATTFRLGGVETGGTTCKLSLSVLTSLTDSPGDHVQHQFAIPTTTPEETLTIIAKTLHDWNVDAIGISSFGPIDLDPSSPTYGYITSTPKPNWGNVDVVGGIRRKLIEYAAGDEQLKQKYNALPMAFNTDVNAAAAAEIEYGGHADCGSLAYLTIGTGVGGGIAMKIPGHGIVMLSNALHPEVGHITVARHPDEVLPKGGCPFHEQCCEGYANSHATARRANLVESQLPDIPDDHLTWTCTAFYLAHLCATLVYTVSPHRIIVGGGLAKRECMVAKMRELLPQILNDYIQTAQIKDMTTFIQTSRFDLPESHTSAGAVGALYLALNVLRK